MSKLKRGQWRVLMYFGSDDYDRNLVRDQARILGGGFEADLMMGNAEAFFHSERGANHFVTRILANKPHWRLAVERIPASKGITSRQGVL
ncbi:MAG TPA: hypothetical protein VGG64_13595 [Pirellulales bacterium]|jgi:hypothetical protein